MVKSSSICCKLSLHSRSASESSSVSSRELCESDEGRESRSSSESWVGESRMYEVDSSEDIVAAWSLLESKLEMAYSRLPRSFESRLESY
jgi:hypothetical protein